REKALQMLYRLDISGGGPGVGAGGGAGGGGGGQQDESRSVTTEGGKKKESYWQVIGEGVMSNIAEIDRLIDGASKNWSLTRMAVVDRNILRIAVYELLYHSDVPCKVVMDQAVELANRFGAENSGPFINGVIESLYKEILRDRHPSMSSAGEVK
ncbi:MAG: transcription antitermination factor NusB, partial [Thermodesulfobacteriota bacterium]